MIKSKANKICQGKCAECGSSDIDYGSMDVDGGSVAYEYNCPDCEHSGTEWYNLDYVDSD